MAYDAEKDVLLEKIGTLKTGDNSRLLVAAYSYDGGEVRIGTVLQTKGKGGKVFTRAAGRMSVKQKSWEADKVKEWVEKRAKKVEAKVKPKKKKKDEADW